MRPSDRIRKATLVDTESYSFSAFVEMLDRYDDDIGSYVKINVYDDEGEYRWIPLIGASQTTSLFNIFKSEHKWLVAVFQARAGGFESSFGVLIPRNSAEVKEKLKNKETYRGKLGLDNIMPGS